MIKSENLGDCEYKLAVIDFRGGYGKTGSDILQGWVLKTMANFQKGFWEHASGYIIMQRRIVLPGQ